MLPQSQERKKQNSSKVNLLISFIFHTLIVVVMFYFAARQGLLGKQMKKIAVEMVKEKPPEKPKEPEKPKMESPKVETPKVVEKPKEVEEAKAAPPPSTMAPPTVAPPAAELPSFEFEGGKTVETSSDAVQIYKSYLEYALRSKWQRPDNLADENYVAEVEVAVNRAGDVSDPVWRKGSGDPKWDESVRKVFVTVSRLDHPPPTNYPPRETIRFDVQGETEPVLQ
jgi:outer membrane biosynthesis protein TonB